MSRCNIKYYENNANFGFRDLLGKLAYLAAIWLHLEEYWCISRIIQAETATQQSLLQQIFYALHPSWPWRH